MRVWVACLALAALTMLAAPVAADMFRTSLVGGRPDWAMSGGDQGCDICSGNHAGHGHSQGSGFSSSSSSHTSRYSSGGSHLAPRFGSPAGRLHRGGSGRRTYHFTSEESEYTFSNGTHSTTITSKRSSEGVPEFHLKMTRLTDGAVIESTVLSEAEYRARRASLGLTGTDGSFGFESLGGAAAARDIHGLSAGRFSSDDMLTELEQRLGHRLAGRGRGSGHHSTTSGFSSEESFYSFSNGTHTTSITGRRNSDGVREYGLELIRDADRAVLDRATISEAEYNRRRENMVGGDGFRDVFDIHGIRGSASRHDSRFNSRHDSRSEFGSDSAESGYDSRFRGRRPSHGGSSGSKTTSYFSEERTETRHEGSETCSCVARARCDYSRRVYSAEALRRCRSREVCCRSEEQNTRPLLPAQPTGYPRRPTEQPVPRPQAEPQIREKEPDCNCVLRDACTLRERDYSLAGLEKCRSPMVCCKRRLVSSPDRTRAPLIPTPTPAVRRTTPNAAFLDSERNLFRDIVQHVDTNEAPVQRPLDISGLQASLSRYDDTRDISGGHRRTEIRHTEQKRTETSNVNQPRYTAPLPATSGEQSSSSSHRRRFSSHSSTTDQHAALPEHFDRQRPLLDRDSGTTHSRKSYSYKQTSSSSGGLENDLLSGASRRYGDDDSAEQSGGRRVISTSRHYTERRVSSGEDSGEDVRPLLDTGAYSRFDSSGRRTEQQPVDLPGPQLGSSSSQHYSYRSSTSSQSSSGDLGDAGRLLGADDAGQHRLRTQLHDLGQYGDQEPSVTSSSRRYVSQRTVSGGSSGGTGSELLAGSGSELLSGSGSGLSGGERSTSSRHYSERRIVSGDAGGADLDLGTGLSGGLGGSGGYSSGSRYSSSSSWSSRSESGSSGGGLVPAGDLHSSYPAGASGSSGSSYRYKSSSHSSQTAPVESGSSSYWSSYSQQSQRHRRGLSSLFRDRDEDNCVCVRFDRCSDGNLLHHGADLLDFSIGSRKQCSGFRVCCDTPPETLRQLESTPGLQRGVVTSVPTSDLAVIESRSSPLAPHVSSSQPCVCVSSYLCQDGRIGASQQLLVDMRQVSQTGRCNYDGQVCCAVPWAQVQPTAPPPPCSCVSSSQCRQQDILTRYTNPNAPVCPGTEVCCSRPLTRPGPPPGSRGTDRVEYDMYLFCKSYPLSVACSATHQFSVLPTIQPTPYFNAERDARALANAFGLLTADDEVLINILTKRTFQERALIKQAFYSITKKDLADRIDSYTSGNYKDLMVELLDGNSMEEYLAKRLHEAMDRIGTDEDAVLETIISSTSQELEVIKGFFYKESGHTLEDDIEDDFSDDLEDILVSLVNGSRDTSFTVNRPRAREQAVSLRRAGQDRLGTEEETFIHFLTRENYAQLALIASEYEELTGRALEESLKKEFSGHTEDALVAIVEATKNLPAYFASRLYDALWSRGILSKDDSVIRRIIISRAERDLGSIAQEYHRRYGNSLKDDIETKATSDYEDALVSLLGGES